MGATYHFKRNGAIKMVPGTALQISAVRCQAPFPISWETSLRLPVASAVKRGLGRLSGWLSG